jgi:hypothetical protein
MRPLSALVLAVTLTGWLASTGADAAQWSERLVLLFVDDLHFDFRSTLRLRDLLLQLVARVTNEGDRVAVVTTGYSSVFIAPTTELEVVLSGLRRISGGALPADEALERRGIRERRRRARIALATARRTIASLDAIAIGPRVMIYVSGGYGERNLTPALADIAASANNASTTIHAFDARSLAGGPDPAPSVSNQSDWDAYHRDAQSNLWALAGSTGGHFISAESEIDRLMDQIGSVR